VKVNFKGTLLDGTVFDSTENHKEPSVFPVHGGPKAMDEALSMMTVGSKWKLFMPTDANSGFELVVLGLQNIPPGATLIFEVEVLSIEPPKSGTQPASKP
jgi:FKBP-type peptidyl-prolyl cis-trans isomerase FklB